MPHPHEVLDLYRFQSADNRFAHLSLQDLVEARDLYHMQLMTHANVVATALGRYRIRIDDSWPNEKEHRKGTYARRLDNSEVRPYSWPCVLVFVKEWKEVDELEDPGQLVPKTLYMPDGRCVPVCIVEAPREDTEQSLAPRDVRFPTNNVGPGFPIIAEVQGRRYLATIGCLVSDGHRIYGLTNRHVTGAEGEPVDSMLDGKQVRVGASSAKQLTRLPFTEVYPSLAGRDTYVNLDMGLIDIDDLSRWTTKVRGVDPKKMGPMADFSDQQLSLSLVGCHVLGVGAAGGTMRGEIHGLFYRYQTRGGFEYVADLYIGPRAADAKSDGSPVPFVTLPGDSGTMWMLDPLPRHEGLNGDQEESLLRPLALQWGRNMLYSGEASPPQGFALATLMSRACDLLEVDPVREWNVGQADTWGAMGHFAIGARTVTTLSKRYPRLAKLMDNNRTVISRDENALLKGEFTGMGKAAFVPLADVPDFYWKPNVAWQGHSRASEGPNHFADMDQRGPDGRTLLDLTTDPLAIKPERWNTFYDSVRDILTGKPIEPAHRGLLPFRVWQIFDEMVDFAAAGKGHEFVCAAGVLAHYVGDACQPLHISYLHDGDPNRPVEHTVTRGVHAGEIHREALGKGIHSLYEDTMVHLHRKDILAALAKTPVPQSTDDVQDGFEAARKTLEMMRKTIAAIPPLGLVSAYMDFGHGGQAGAEVLWNQFGSATIQVMQDGTHLLAALWESAWRLGDGETNVKSVEQLTHQQAMAIVQGEGFLPSRTIDQIGPLLKVHS